jgi:hypothetical protein
MEPRKVNTLGNKLAVMDGDGRLIKTVTVYGLKEFLAATVGEYREETHGNGEEYLRAADEMLTGPFLDLSTIYWHAWRGEKVNIDAVVHSCVRLGCENIVLEHLPDSAEGSMLF